MKNILFLAFFGILLSASVMANPINLMEEGTPMEISEVNYEINENIIYELNKNEYIKALIKGYDSVGIQIEETFYEVTIKENNITNIQKKEKHTEVGYTIKTDLPEILFIYANHNTMSKVDIFRTLVLDKDIPMKVIFRVVNLLMRGA